MKKTGVLFDMDGLLLDTEVYYQDSWRELAAERGIELAKGFTEEVSGTNGDLMRAVIKKHFQVDEADALIAECRARVKDKTNRSVSLKPGVVEILQYFKDAGYCIAVASSSTIEQIEKNLERTQIADYFDQVICGAQVEHGKPAPDIFLYAAERIGCKPEECYVFEDSENGIKAGFAAGCASVMIPDQVAPKPEIRQYCAGIYDNLLDAMEAIRKSEI